MLSDKELGKIMLLLRAAPLQHVVTLKMLHLLGSGVDFRFIEGSDGWALRSLFPANAFEYDRQTYPDQELVVLIDGTSTSAKLELLGGLPRVPLVVKTYDKSVAAHLESKRSASRVRSFLSFTTDDTEQLPPVPPGILLGTVLNPEVSRMFASNGYQDSELARHFADGARWFFAQKQGRGCSAGFVFRNFESVWEIGGLYTEPEYRRQGLGRQIVAAALRHLVGSGRIPRYQVRSDNEPSIRLALASGLKEFLRMDHFLVDAAGFR
jgi:ribosomal protein S18 acetylase RimI-like enzyme